MTVVSEKFAGENACRDDPVTPRCVFSSTKSKTEPKPSLVMKPIIPFALLGALFAVGAANAQSSTTPVGYTTTALGPNKFTFVGLTVQNPVVSAGTLDAESANSVTDTGVDFVALLGAPGAASGTYVLELADGTIQEVTNWTDAGVLTTPDDITGKVTPTTTTYTLRKAATISDVFGANNSAGLTPDADGEYTTGNDIVYVIGAGGAATAVYYYDDGDVAGWFDALGNDAANKPIVYADGFYVKRGAGISIDLVTTGEVKTTPTSGALTAGWNYVSSVAPVGLTLATSGLQNFLSTDSTGEYTTVDNVYLPQPNGSFKIAYYYDDGDLAGWFDSTGGDANALPLEGAFLILNRGVTKPYTLSVPASYSSL